MNDYESQILGSATAPDITELFSMQMEQFNKQLRKLNKRKKDKNGKGQKKLKKRLRALEQEYQQLEQLIFFAMYQSQMLTTKAPRQQWWQTAVTNSIPKALELATVSVSRLPPRSQSLPVLPEARDRN